MGRPSRPPEIYDYHKRFSPAKAERTVAEYDLVIALLEVNPVIFRERETGWRVYPFDSGAYLLFYRELESMWLVAGMFHAHRRPSWIGEQLGGRFK